MNIPQTWDMKTTDVGYEREAFTKTSEAFAAGTRCGVFATSVRQNGRGGGGGEKILPRK